MNPVIRMRSALEGVRRAFSYAPGRGPEWYQQLVEVLDSDLRESVEADALPAGPLTGIRLEMVPYPHLRNDRGAVLARDYVQVATVERLLSAATAWQGLYDALGCPEPDGFKTQSSMDAALERVRALVAALREWKCPSCGGHGEYLQRGAEYPSEGIWVPCKVCGGKRVHPRAQQALEGVPS